MKFGCNRGHYHQHVCEVSKQTTGFIRRYVYNLFNIAPNKLKLTEYVRGVIISIPTKCEVILKKYLNF